MKHGGPCISARKIDHGILITKMINKVSMGMVKLISAQAAFKKI